MMKRLISCISLLLLLVAIFPLVAQNNNNASFDYFRRIERTSQPDFKSTRKKPGLLTKEDWQVLIDERWGEGLPTSDKLKIFDLFWEEIDTAYPSFHNLDIDWNLLKDTLRPEVAAGVSRGRFNAIMNKLATVLKDNHTYISDAPVSRDSLKPGVPIFVPTGYQSAINRDRYGDEFCHFGASLAPMPDSSLFVYDVIPDHPLGLQRGDLVLGYDQVPWKDLYKEVLRAELPIYGHGRYGSNEFSIVHGFLISCGENWHLFDTIDIVKYDTGDTVHLATALLENKQMKLFTTGQMPIDGVPFPDVDNGHWVGWGIVEGTNIGYIYIWNWSANGDYPYPTTSTGDDFKLAIETLIKDFNISGLIIDSRFNLGGRPQEYNKGLTILFNLDQAIFGHYERSDADDHYTLKPFCYECWPGFSPADLQFHADSYLFDKPIAVLTGPNSLSAGDLMPMQMRFHPMSRIFGLTTNGAFGATTANELPYISHPIQSFPDWIFHRTISNLKVSVYSDKYLTHLNIPPDEELWLTREDAVRGEDTVVKRAIEWINNLAFTHNVTINKTYVKSGIDTVYITAEINNPNQNELSLEAAINSLDGALDDSLNLFDDGMHGDSLTDDNIWGNFYLPIDTKEQAYEVSITTSDLTEETSRTLPHAAWFTTIGPIVFDGYAIIDNFFTIYNIKLSLKNEGQSALAPNIIAELTSLDTNITNINSKSNYSIYIPAGQTVETIQSFNVAVKGSPDSVRINIDIYSNGYHYWSDSFNLNLGTTDIAKNSQDVPSKFSLSQNYPNPFNPSTKIRFALPKPGTVKIEVYNIIGQKIETLLNKPMPAGYHEVEFNGHDLSSGIYLYRIQAGDLQDVKKMVLIR